MLFRTRPGSKQHPQDVQVQQMSTIPAKMLIFNDCILPAHVAKLTWGMNMITNMLMLIHHCVVLNTKGVIYQQQSGAPCS